jgi:hypothetical protein
MNKLLETGISLVLIFFIFSIITYVIQELIAVNLKYRSKMLWKSMSQLMDGFILDGRVKLLKSMPTGQTPLTNTFYNHAQILSLQKDLNRRPNYIPAANFALAIMDIVAKNAPARTGSLFADFQSGLQTFVAHKGNLHEVLKNLLATSANLKELQEKIETWFNSYMQRVTGWYESHTVVPVRIIAAILTLVFNINVIKLAKTIYKDDQLRASMVSMAEKMADNPESVTKYYTKAFDSKVGSLDTFYKQRMKDSALTAEQKKQLETEKDDSLQKLAAQYTKTQIAVIRSFTKDLDSVKLPLGWRNETWATDVKRNENGYGGFINFLVALAGWFIAACCISMGAPFWFDMLGKLVNVRRSGVKPKT